MSATLPRPPSEPQMRLLFALLGHLGIDDRPERLEFVGRLVGRTIESCRELTRRDVSHLVDQLSTGGDRDAHRP